MGKQSMRRKLYYTLSLISLFTQHGFSETEAPVLHDLHCKTGCIVLPALYDMDVPLPADETFSAAPTEDLVINLSAIITPNNACTTPNGAINLTVTGTGAPYGFSWSNMATTEDISGLAAGTYTVTVTNGLGESAIASYVVTQNTLLPSISASVSPSICGQNNGSINLTINNGIGPYTFLWSNSAITEDIFNLAPASYTVTVTAANGCVSFTLIPISDVGPNFTASAVTTANTLCNGLGNGSIDVSVTGAGPYTYLWSNTAVTQDLANLTAGTYTLTVSASNGCSVTISEMLANNPNPFSLTATTIENTSCGAPNGSVDISVSVPGTYTYLWSNSAVTQDLQNVSPGIYGVTVTNSNACTATISDTVTNNLALFSLTDTTFANTSCGSPNGSVNITVSVPGTYTYLWSNSAVTEDLQNLAPGIYSVTVTNANACTAMISDTIENNLALFTLSAATVANTSCVSPNGSVDVSASAPDTYIYLWSNSAVTEDLQNLSLGTYTLTVTNSSSCTATISETVANNPPTFTLTGTSVANTSCISPNGSVDITPSVPGAYTYLWSNTAVTEDLQNLAPDIYFLTVTGLNGCTATIFETVANNSPTFTLTSATVSNTSCTAPNGSVDITPSVAGTYTYLWSNSAVTEDLQNLAPGPYSLTVTGSNGCTASISETVADNSAPFSLTSAMVANTSCTAPNGSVNVTVSLAGTYTYLWSNSAVTEDLQNVAPGTYSLTVTGANGCTASVSETVADDSTPFSLTGATVANTSCAAPNGSVDITPSIPGTYTYLWSNSAVTEDLQNLAPGTYSLTVTGLNNCTATISETITDNSPVFNLTGTTLANTSCAAPNGSVNITTSTPGSYTYLWSNSAVTEDLQNVAPGTYSLTVTGLNSCTATISETITDNSPVFNLTGTTLANTSCAAPNGSVNITTSTPGSYTYLWSNNAITEDLQNVAPGIYSLTVTGSNGCTASISETVTDNSTSFSLTSSVVANTSCLAANGSVNITTSAPGTYTYLWSNNAVTEDLQNLAPGLYSLTVTDANGCTATISETVAENSASFSLTSAASPNTSCSVANGSIEITVSVPGTYTYLWSNNAVTEDLHDLAPGVYSLTVSNANGCSATASETVTNNSTAFTLSITSSANTSCLSANGALDLNISAAGVFTYLWSNNAITEDLSGVAAGTYSVTVSDANACSKTLSGAVSDNFSLATIELIPSAATCGQNNGFVQLNISAGAAPFAFQWSNGAVTQSISGVGSENYSVTVTGANGCTQTANTDVSVNGQHFTLSAVTAGNVSCTTPVGMIDLSISATGNFTYHWSNNATSQDLSGLDAGIYRVTVTDQANCSATAIFTIPNDIAPPQVDAFVLPGDCENPQGSISVELIQGGTPPVLFSIDGGNTYSAQMEYTNLVPGSYQVMAKDAGECTSFAVVEVPEIIVPFITPSPDIILEYGETTVLQVMLPPGFPMSEIETVIWSPSEGLEFVGPNILDLLQPKLTMTKSAIYTVHVLAKSGCEATAEYRIQLQVARDVYTPNVMWPEDPDGNNAAFTLYAKEGALREISSLRVFDRWGNELFLREHFEAGELRLGWQGDFRGKAMPPGVYVWLAEVEWIDGRRTTLKGDVTIVR